MGTQLVELDETMYWIFWVKRIPKCLKTMLEGPHVHKWNKHMNVNLKESEENLKSTPG